MSLDMLVESVEAWAEEKGIFNSNNPLPQFLKVVEEVGELSEALTKNYNYVEEIGDVLVTIICLSRQLDTDVETCLKSAYDKISKRKGKMMNGVFVKQEDLLNSQGC